MPVDTSVLLEILSQVAPCFKALFCMCQLVGNPFCTLLGLQHITLPLPPKHLFPLPGTSLTAAILCDGLYSRFLGADATRIIFWRLVKAHNVYKAHCRLWMIFYLRRWLNFNSEFSKLTWPFITSLRLEDLATCPPAFRRKHWDDLHGIYWCSKARNGISQM